MRRVSFEVLMMYYMEYYVYVEEDKLKAPYWFNRKTRKFEDRNNLLELLGEYNEDMYRKSGWIPVDSVDVLQFAKEFIIRTQRNDLIELIHDLQGEELEGRINRIIENEDMGVEWVKELTRYKTDKAISWLKENHIRYARSGLMRRISFEDVMMWMEKYVHDEEDKLKALFWFNKKTKKFEDRYTLSELLGEYNEDKYRKKHWIPLNSVDVLRLAKEFIIRTQRNDLIELIYDREGEDLEEGINMIFANIDNEDMSEEWFNELERYKISAAISWLKKNRIRYERSADTKDDQNS
jgi:hypothetical protein